MADSSVETWPLVVLAQTGVASQGSPEEIARALKEDGKACRAVSDVRELIETLREDRCFCVFMSSDFVKDVTVPIRAARQVSAVEWFVIVPPETDRKFSYRVIEAGAKGILTSPLTVFQYVQRARQVLASQDIEERMKKLHKDVRPAGGSVARSEPVVTIPKRPKPGPTDGVEIFRGARDYSTRRPEWRKIVQSQASRNFTGLDDYRSETELDLLELVQTERRASVNLMTLRPNATLQEFPPRKVRSVASSNILEKREVEDIEAYPEIVSALELGQPVAVPDIRSSVRHGADVAESLLSKGVVSRAAIPLYSDGQIRGVMTVQFAEPLNPRLRELLDDLVPLSAQLMPSFSKIDFLSRVYQAHGL